MEQNAGISHISKPVLHASPQFRLSRGPCVDLCRIMCISASVQQNERCRTNSVPRPGIYNMLIPILQARSPGENLRRCISDDTLQVARPLH